MNSVKLFETFDFFLSEFNDEQKQAIISQSKKLLCVAGAGSGKTATLTKRIEFLIKFQSIKPEKILAITFTRKARQEMERRLKNFGVFDVKVETFNSFCEKFLIKYSNKVYGRNMKVISYGDKIALIKQALLSCNKSIEQAVNLYYHNKKSKTFEELSRGFMNDCFTVLEYCKNENKQLNDFLNNNLSIRERVSAKLVNDVCVELEKLMHQNSFRDYSDQLIHVVNFLLKNPEFIPLFDHILVDEYQDINLSQIKLINILNPKNVFYVGDPRQSIFGWRGSKISFILNFDGDLINLVKNYRSSEKIVNVMNEAIKSMKLSDLRSVKLGGKVNLNTFNNENEEYVFVVEQILKSNVSKNEIFVLARTHRQLKELSEYMAVRQIDHVVRSEEKNVVAKNDQVTLATIHAIKGMEADTVFVIGCNGKNFPCKVNDHPVVDLIKDYDYNRLEEERRLFYVAMSRAKNELYLSCVGNPTKFIIPIEHFFDIKVNNGKLDTFDRLKQWRRELAHEKNIPPYLIFHDSVLLELSARKPETLAELAYIKGVGPIKVGRYGETLLSILNQSFL